MKDAEFENGYSYDSFFETFQSCTRGEVSFAYKDVRETLSFVPVEGTDWLLTYLIKESVIGNEISYITDDIVRRSIIQSVITVAAVFGMFAFILMQTKRNNKLKGGVSNLALDPIAAPISELAEKPRSKTPGDFSKLYDEIKLQTEKLSKLAE
ncbi:MAG: hypothetical protein K6G89_03350 [Clostridia bacterium]|nr:hypothetical protein [Clostridia bacterium]